MDRDALTLAITRRRERLAGYEERRNRLLGIVEARADEYADQTPGGASGYVGKTLKVVGTGATARTELEYVVDATLLRALLALEEQAARETGQWFEKEAPINVQQVQVTERRVVRLPPRELPEDVRDSIERVLAADAEGDVEEGEFRAVPPKSWAELLTRGEAESGVPATAREWKYAREADAAGIPPPASIDAGLRRREED